MKTKLQYRINLLTILVAGIFAVSPVRAQITGIHSADSYSTNVFQDTTSFNPSSNPGKFYFTGAGPWNGGPVGIIQTDSTTGDSAQGSVSASFSGNSYTITVANASINQQSGNTGSATLQFGFSIHYTIGPAGLPVQPVLFPHFVVSGAVQNTPGAYAQVQGQIGYYDSTFAQIDYVTYNWVDNTAGSTFSTVSIAGTPTTINTPALPANSDLYVSGGFAFTVDPATFSSVATVQAPAIGIGIYSNSPVVFFPTTPGTNFTVLMATNLASPNWVPVTNGVPFSGFEITNAPSPAFFRLQ